MEPVNIQYSLNILGSDATTVTDRVMDITAQERFQQAMQPTQAPNAETIVIGKTGSADTLGDKILQGVQQVKTGYDNQVNAVQETLQSPDPISVNDMLTLQMDLAKLTLQGELLSKTVSKSTQNLDTLLKSQ